MESLASLVESEGYRVEVVKGGDVSITKGDKQWRTVGLGH